MTRLGMTRLENWILKSAEQLIVGGKYKTTMYAQGIVYDHPYARDESYIDTLPVNEIHINHDTGEVSIFAGRTQYINQLSGIDTGMMKKREMVLFEPDTVHKEGLTICLDINEARIVDRVCCKHQREVTHSFGCVKSKALDIIHAKCGNNYVTLRTTDIAGLQFELLVNSNESRIYVVNSGSAVLHFLCAGKDWHINPDEILELLDI